MFCLGPSTTVFHPAIFAAMTDPDRAKQVSAPVGPDDKTPDVLTRDVLAPDVLAPDVLACGGKDKSHHDLDADALLALDAARKLKPGPQRAAAMKRAGSLRHAADLRGMSFAPRGRPRKS